MTENVYNENSKLFSLYTFSVIWTEFASRLDLINSSANCHLDSNYSSLISSTRLQSRSCSIHQLYCCLLSSFHLLYLFAGMHGLKATSPQQV